jgi:hypothetical protein
MRLPTVALGASLVLVLSPAIEVSYAADPRPYYANGFAELASELGPSMTGDPLELEHPPTDGSDRDPDQDVQAVQLTSKGLFVWAHDEATFFDGVETHKHHPKLTAGSSGGWKPAGNLSVAVPSGPWAALSNCEAGGNPRTNTGNGYYGMYQEDLSFWAAYGNTKQYARPDLAPPSEQLAAAQLGLKAQGWRAWPACSRRLGLR